MPSPNPQASVRATANPRREESASKAQGAPLDRRLSPSPRPLIPGESRGAESASLRLSVKEQ